MKSFVFRATRVKPCSIAVAARIGSGCEQVWFSVRPYATRMRASEACALRVFSVVQWTRCAGESSAFDLFDMLPTRCPESRKRGLRDRAESGVRPSHWLYDGSSGCASRLRSSSSPSPFRRAERRSPRQHPSSPEKARGVSPIRSSSSWTDPTGWEPPPSTA